MQMLMMNDQNLGSSPNQDPKTGQSLVSAAIKFLHPILRSAALDHSSFGCKGWKDERSPHANGTLRT